MNYRAHDVLACVILVENSLISHFLRLQKLFIILPHHEKVVGTWNALIQTVKYREEEVTRNIACQLLELIKVHTAFWVLFK